EKGEPEWFVFQKGSMKKMCGGTIRTPVAEEINNKHDAKLISAAPEVLEALHAVVRVADRQTDEFDMARAAIAKALGK
ncbi:MAG: hypothetical protein RR068_16610, partial [Hafnia sp.]